MLPKEERDEKVGGGINQGGEWVLHLFSIGRSFSLVSTHWSNNREGFTYTSHIDFDIHIYIYTLYFIIPNDTIIN